jgi:Bacterial TniB protein
MFFQAMTMQHRKMMLCSKRRNRMASQSDHNDDPFDSKQWHMLTDQQRYKLIDQLFIGHPRVLPIFEAFERTAAGIQESDAGRPYGMALLGEPGVGKTAILHNWMKMTRIQRIDLQEEKQPFLSVCFTPAVTTKSILAACGDPCNTAGTQWNMAMRLQRLIKAYHGAVICLDGIHHPVVHRELGRVQHDCMNLLEQMITSTEIAPILIGDQEATMELLHASPHLQCRIETVHFLYAFEWDRQRPSTISEFRTLLRGIDLALPLDPSSLDKEEIAYPIFYASKGNPRHLFALIRAGARKAVHIRANTLTREILADVYDEQGMMARGEHINPFSTPGFWET